MSSSKAEGRGPRPFTFPVFETSERELRQRAYQEGFHKGYEDGSAEGRRRMEEVLRRLEAILKTLEGAREQIFRGAEEEILELAMAIAKKILRRELQTDREAVLRTLREAISRVTEGDVVKIFLSPDDIELVREHRAELLEGAEGKGVVLRADRGIMPGGCFIETDFGHVDARIESQLLEIERGLKGENGG